MTPDIVKIEYPVDSLVSYHYYRNDRDMLGITRTGRLRLIGDSGAFSAYHQGSVISLGEYADWCQRWRAHLYWIASLDVIGDPQTTFRNWRTLRDKHGLETVPTLHAGTSTKWLDAYAAEGVDFMGLGGMIAGAANAFRWLLHTFRHARDNHPQMRFHGWAVTHRKVTSALPFYSVDSSGVTGAAYRFGQLKVFNPATAEHHTVRLDGQSVYRVAGLLRRVYGVNPDEITRSHPGNRATLIKLAAASTQRWADWLQRRHKVPAPRWSINPSCCITDGPAPGTRIHLVNNVGTPGNSDLDKAVESPTASGTRVHLVDTGVGLPTLAGTTDGTRAVPAEVDSEPTTREATP